MSFHLSKSKYCCGVQCPKMLWMHKYMHEKFDESVMNEAVLTTGNEVGDLAMGLLGEYTEVPFNGDDLGAMIRDTQRLMDTPTPVICEASFSYDGLFCSVDLLKNLGSGVVELYEVKSSTSLHDIYRHDVAYQVYILRSLGYDVRRACLVHINNEYVRHGDLDLSALFSVEDITTDAMNRQVEVAQCLSDFQAYLSQIEEPEFGIGLHCFSPYSCGYFSYCTRNLPIPNIFSVRGLSKSKMFDCYHDGHVSFNEILYERRLTAKQRQQVDFTLNHRSPEIRKPSIRSFLSTLSYPLYFLDFESFQPAVPLYDNSRPFQQIVFQYSLHWICHEGGELHHTEFLAQPGEDPRRSLAVQLCQDIPLNVCTTAYNMSFEKGRIRELAELYPDLRSHLMNIHDHICDLMVPFQHRDYYSAEMQGSYSIKYVLPALYPDDPSLNYHNLEGVHNGGEASAEFMKMQSMTPEELQISRANLLKYCGLDTYAMVKVWQKLNDAVM